MKTIHALLIGLVLASVALGVMYYKVHYLDFPLQPNKESKSWHIEAKIEFLAKNSPAKATLMLPQNYDNYVLIDENFISEGYGLSTRTDAKNGNRTVTWSKRKAHGEQAIFYQGILYAFDSAMPSKEKKSKKIKPSKLDRASFPNASGALDERHPYFVALDAVINEIKEHSADEVTFILELYKFLNSSDDDRIGIIRKRDKKTSLNTPQLAALILNEAGIPARSINGIELEEERRFVALQKWVEVYVDDTWHTINPKTGRFGLENKYFRWWEGDKNILSLDGGRKADIRISIKQNTEEAINVALWKGKESNELLLSFSLFSLPIDTQLVFQVLLLIPIGGLAIAFMRQVIGLKTFGTFMPVLIAISFRETQLVTGVILFTSVVIIGLFIRAYFDRLQLLLVPRLTAVLTIVVLLITALTVITHKLNIVAGLSISLFPMVILTMTIERMSIAWEEYGAHNAIITGLGSLVAAIISYLCMANPYVMHIIFVFPELLLIVLAISIVIGRYHGYKLTEYFRFRAIKQAA